MSRNPGQRARKNAVASESDDEEDDETTTQSNPDRKDEDNTATHMLIVTLKYDRPPKKAVAAFPRVPLLDRSTIPHVLTQTLHGHVRFDQPSEVTVELPWVLRLRHSFQYVVNPTTQAVLSQICSLANIICNQVNMWFDGIDGRFETVFDLDDQGSPAQFITPSVEVGTPLDGPDNNIFPAGRRSPKMVVDSKNWEHCLERTNSNLRREQSKLRKAIEALKRFIAENGLDPRQIVAANTSTDTSENGSVTMEFAREYEKWYCEQLLKFISVATDWTLQRHDFAATLEDVNACTGGRTEIWTKSMEYVVQGPDACGEVRAVIGQGLVYVIEDRFVEGPLTASKFGARAGLEGTEGCNGGIREEVKSGANTNTLSGCEHDFNSSPDSGQPSAEQAHDQSRGEDEEDEPESDSSTIHVVPLVRRPLPPRYPQQQEAEAEDGKENEAEDEEQYRSDVEAEAQKYEGEREMMRKSTKSTSMDTSTNMTPIKLSMRGSLSTYMGLLSWQKPGHWGKK